MMLHSTIPRRLAWRRAELGLLQSELANRSGLSVSAVCHIEGGQYAGVRFQSIIALADAVFIGPDLLAGYDRDPEQVRRALALRPVDLYHPVITAAETLAGIRLKCMYCEHLLVAGIVHTDEECQRLCYDRMELSRLHRIRRLMLMPAIVGSSS